MHLSTSPLLLVVGVEQALVTVATAPQDEVFTAEALCDVETFLHLQHRWEVVCVWARGGGRTRAGGGGAAKVGIGSGTGCRDKPCLRGSVADDRRVGVCGCAVHVACMREELGRGPEQRDARLLLLRRKLVGHLMTRAQGGEVRVPIVSRPGLGVFDGVEGW